LQRFFAIFAVENAPMSRQVDSALLRALEECTILAGKLHRYIVAKQQNPKFRESCEK
jgi:hypothetical protein